MKRFLGIAAAAFCLLLSMPLVHWMRGFPPDVPLAGAEKTIPLPECSGAAWWNGELQSGFDSWLSQRLGLRGLLVRTANQIQFTLFGELSVRRGTQVLMGRDGFLFERVYVDAYNKGGTRPAKELRHVSASTRVLQEYLAADGVTLLLVIAPSKAEIYPEFLPEGTDVAGRPERQSNYENLIRFLRRDGVHLVDAHELFLEWKREPGAPLLFGKGGTHWSQYGAARVVARITKKLRALSGRDYPALHVRGSVTNRTVVGADNDLAELLNLWSARSLAGPQVHPVLERQAGSLLPDILFIGDSFVFTLTDIMDREELYRERDTYYYYKRRLAYPEGKDALLDKRQLDLLAEVRRRDVVLIEVSEYWLPRIGFGFVRDLLQAYVREDLAQGRTPRAWSFLRNMRTP